MAKRSSGGSRPPRKSARPGWSVPDPRPASQILAEETLLTKSMLAKVLGYKSVRTIDLIVAEDCATDDPVLTPIYLRRPLVSGSGGRPKHFPSFKSLRFRREDVLAYIEKMREEFPADLEWKVGGVRTEGKKI